MGIVLDHRSKCSVTEGLMAMQQLHTYVVLEVLLNAVLASAQAIKIYKECLSLQI